MGSEVLGNEAPCRDNGDTWSDAWDNKSSTSEADPYEQDPHPDALYYLRIPDGVTHSLSALACPGLGVHFVSLFMQHV